MDLGLPDIDGWEATRRIKADPATAAVPVVVLSAHATNDAKERAFAAGCEEFETKPVNWEELFKKIEEAIRKAVERAQAQATPTPAPVAEIDALANTDLLPGLPPGPAEVEKDLCAVEQKRILVAEDNDPNREMLCRRLNKHGYATTEAANGAEALERVREERFDLVLCDIMMPGVDGFTVLQEMKADPALAAVPVIMISAVDETASIARCIEMGAEDYLHKPYDPVLLRARINACLDKRRLRDQELDYLRAVADLTRAADLVERGAFDPAVLAAVAARPDALGGLARVFDRMARAVQANVNQLQSDVRRLTAEIDKK
jgi:CheY-like chemotaxis protein